MQLDKQCKQCGSDNWFPKKDTRCTAGFFYSCRECKKVHKKRSAEKTGYKQTINPKLRTAYLGRRKLAREKNKESIAAYSKIYRQTHKAERLALQRKREANKQQAVPEWADNSIIKDFYIEAQYHQMQVDHIVPLNSEYVCGLHCEDNMQLLTSEENMSKGNRYWPDM